MLKWNFAFKYNFILLFYAKNKSTMKGTLKAKFVSMRESCDIDCMY